MANDRLRELRKVGARQSAEVVELAESMFEKGEVKALGDELWLFLEQVAVAALDIGKLDLAVMCVGRLQQRFPDSSRVLPLQGMILEARGQYGAAQGLYESELAKSVATEGSNGATGESNVRIRKRLIGLHLNHSPISTPSSALVSTPANSSSPLAVHKGIELLVAHLDTVYSDPEGWMQLVDAYASLGMYSESASALEDLILLQPHNPFHLLRYAETQYTMREYVLAYKTFLRVIEFSGKISDQAKGGAGRRAAIGAKLCLSRVEELPTSPPRTGDVEEMIVEELLAAYSKEWVPLKGAKGGIGAVSAGTEKLVGRQCLSNAMVWPTTLRPKLHEKWFLAILNCTGYLIVQIP